MAKTNWITEPKLYKSRGLEWTEHYGIYRARIGGFMDLTVCYDNSKNGFSEYRVTVAGLTAKHKPGSIETGMDLAVAVAKKLLTQASQELEHIQ